MPQNTGSQTEYHHLGMPMAGEVSLKRNSSQAICADSTPNSAKNAAKFLRGKWDANQKQIHTAKDFIELAATKSSTTGKPYLIRFQDGRQKPCAEILLAELKRIESAPAP
jgi:hypothetical protein